MKKLLTIALLAGIILVPGCGSDKTTQVPLPPDEAAPLMPTGLTAQVQDGRSVVVTWAPNTEPDLAGYRVYLYDPSPRRESAYVLQNQDELLVEAAWTCPIEYNQTFWVRVTAVDSEGNESGAAGPTRIDWQAPPAAPPVMPPPIKPPGGGVHDPNGGGDVGAPGGTGSEPGTDPHGGGESGSEGGGGGTNR